MLDAVLQKTDERTPQQRTFLFRSGYGKHEVVYDVKLSLPHSYLTYRVYCYSTRNPPKTLGLVSTGKIPLNSSVFSTYSQL